MFPAGYVFATPRGTGLRCARWPRCPEWCSQMISGGGSMTGPPRGRMSLAHVTVLETTPPELVSVAAAAGFRSIGIRLTATPSVGIPPYDILSDGPLLRETLLRLADTGVSVLDTEFLRFEPEHPRAIREGCLEVS